MAQEDGSDHHRFQEGFVAAGVRGKLRCTFKTEVFQVQIRSVPTVSPARHFAIAVGTCCEVEENFEIAFATRGHGWAPAPGHTVGTDAVGAGSQPWEYGLLRPGARGQQPRSVRLREVTIPR